MSMKMKVVAAACAALGSAGAFAACPINATVNPGCVIQPATNVVYIAGASAQSQAFNAVAKSLFTTPNDVIRITATAPALDVSDIQKHVAYYGIRGGVPTLLVYRNAGGSGSGTRQLVSVTPTDFTNFVPGSTENRAMTLSTCTGVVGAAGAYTATCSSDLAQVAGLALQDVRPGEHAAGVVPAPVPGAYVAVSALTTVKTGLQGFGVIANPALYSALQAQNLREGKALGFGGQPSIRRADYASLVAQEGNLKDAANLLNDPLDATDTVVCRRVDQSGTQASSNLFFLNNVSGTKGFGGALNPDSALYPKLSFVLNSSTGNVKTCMNTADTKYRLGVVSMENVPVLPADTWKFVAIDGISPNFAYDLNGLTIKADPKQRQSTAAGDYPFAFESYLARRTASGGIIPGLFTDLSTAISDSNVSDLAGFSYLDGAAAWASWDSSLVGVTNNKASRVNRNDNNSQPLLP